MMHFGRGGGIKVRSRGCTLFSTLEFPRGHSRVALGWSLALHAAGIALLIAFGSSIVAPILRHGPAILVFVPPPADTPEPAPFKPPVVHRIFTPPKREMAELKLPPPVIRPPELPVIQPEEHPLRLPSPPVPKAPPVDTARFKPKLPAVEPVKPAAAVKTGGFGTNVAPSGQVRREPVAAVGQFGTAPVKSAPETAALRLPAGSSGFTAVSAAQGAPVEGHAPAGSPAGFGTASAAPVSSNPKTVSRSGFGTVETASATVAGRAGQAQAGGFGDVKVAAGPRPTQSESDPKAVPSVPLEILVKPKPVYTQEARDLRLEGEVVLEVTFTAGGEVRILKVIRGLGHGLDEAAVTAARAIRYRPAQRDGKPVDSTGVIRIQFELAY